MAVKHPGNGAPLVNDDGTPVTMIVLSADHPRVMDATRQTVNDTIKDGQTATVERAEAGRINQAAAAVIEWKNLEYRGEQNPPCTTEIKRTIFREQPWLCEQVLTFSERRANFITA